MSLNKEKIIDFLREYRELCKKHNIFIGGCGCCNSPFLEEGEPDIKHLLKGENLDENTDVDKPLYDIDF